MTMREILFRGKHSPKSMWDYGDLYIDHDKVYISMRETMHGVRVHGEVVPETVGQFTGLTDKNGKKIFEGDIVRAVLPKSNAIPEFVWPDMVVGFSEGAFSAMRGRYCTPLYSFAPAVELEVIGNVHDNPELMEGESHG